MKHIKSYTLFEGVTKIFEDKLSDIIINLEDISIDLKDEGFTVLIKRNFIKYPGGFANYYTKMSGSELSEAINVNISDKGPGNEIGPFAALFIYSQISEVIDRMDAYMDQEGWVKNIFINGNKDTSLTPNTKLRGFRFDYVKKEDMPK